MDVRESIQKEQWPKCVDRNKEPRRFRLSDVLAVIRRGWQPDSPWQARALSLMVALGTRVIELFGDSPLIVSATDWKSPTLPFDWLDPSCLVELQDVAKRNDSVSLRPVLFQTPTRLYDMVMSLRRELATLVPQVIVAAHTPLAAVCQGKPRSVHPSLLGSFNDYVGTQLPECTSHDLRRLYGLLSHNVYGGQCNFNIWLSHVLGHRSDNVQASFYYSVFSIEPDTDWMQCRPVERPPSPPVPMDDKKHDATEVTAASPFPQVNRKMTKEQRWDTLKRAIVQMHDQGIPVSAKKIQVYCKTSTTYAAEALQWYWEWQRSTAM